MTVSPKPDRFPASLEASGLVKLTTPKQSHHFVEVEFVDFSHVVAYSISKLEKVVNLTTLCYTRFTISQMGHALEISQVLLLAANLSSYTLCLASLPRGLLPFHRKLSHFFSQPVFEDIEQWLHSLQDFIVVSYQTESCARCPH